MLTDQAGFCVAVYCFFSIAYGFHALPTYTSSNHSATFGLVSVVLNSIQFFILVNTSFPHCIVRKLFRT